MTSHPFPDEAHVNLGKAQPEVYDRMTAFAESATAAARSADLDQLLIELVRMRASQINGCAFCLRMHTHDAVAAGETLDRLAVLAAWWESDLFSPAEQQALLITERITGISTQRGQLVPTCEDAPLTDAQMGAVSWLAIVMNAWNRVAVTSHYLVKPQRVGSPRGQ